MMLNRTEQEAGDATPPVASLEGATPAVGPASQRDGLLERNFVLVCLSQLIGYVGNGFITPIFPLFMTSLGYSASFTGLSLAALNVVSFNTRPWFGYLVDSGRARRAQSTAGVLLALASLCYLFSSIPVIILGRAIHGLGWGGLNVVGSAWTAYLAPTARRAEAMGYYTMVQRVGITISPVLALWAVGTYGYAPAFLASAVCGLGVTIATLQIAHDRQPPPLTVPFSGSLLRRGIAPGALVGAGLLAISMLSGPAIYAYMPLYFLELGLEHVELYFLVLGVTGIAVRALLGRWSDRMGRVRSITTGFGVGALGLMLIASATDAAGIIFGGVIYTIGGSLSEPSLYAMAIDRSPAERRGAAMATYTMAFQLGGGVGAVISGFVIEFLGYRWLYLGTVGSSLLALTVVVLGARRWHWSANLQNG